MKRRLRPGQRSCSRRLRESGKVRIRSHFLRFSSPSDFGQAAVKCLLELSGQLLSLCHALGYKSRFFENLKKYLTKLSWQVLDKLVKELSALTINNTLTGKPTMFKFRTAAMAFTSVNLDEAGDSSSPPPHAFIYTLVWGGPGQFEWNGKANGEARYLAGEKWVKRKMTYLKTRKAFHLFLEEKQPRKKQRLWAFAVSPRQASNNPTLILYEVYYSDDFSDEDNVKWEEVMWATKIEPEVA